MQVILLSGMILIIDQISKYLVLQELQNKQITIINGIFDLTYVQNMGAAFGIMQNWKYFFLIGTPIILFLLIWWLFSYSNKSKWLKIGTALIIGGAAGNYSDRIRLGYVIDFLDFKIWPVFNLADTSIVIGAIILTAYLIFSEQKKKESKRIDNEGA